MAKSPCLRWQKVEAAWKVVRAANKKATSGQPFWIQDAVLAAEHYCVIRSVPNTSSEVAETGTHSTPRNLLGSCGKHKPSSQEPHPVLLTLFVAMPASVPKAQFECITKIFGA
ncbi:unnamed protein product [Symbiodinium natans]|uniref:Uncharacterized protein n=1 Tax=Symbiodinium natans TaxID=878477 RepID=A0A812K6K6_9DINO|nr:unnamed protein product [Symbiodinium natans]